MDYANYENIFLLAPERIRVLLHRDVSMSNDEDSLDNNIIATRTGEDPNSRPKLKSYAGAEGPITIPRRSTKNTISKINL